VEVKPGAVTDYGTILCKREVNTVN
jgi:hypothetical protein